MFDVNNNNNDLRSIMTIGIDFTCRRLCKYKLLFWYINENLYTKTTIVLLVSTYLLKNFNPTLSAIFLSRLSLRHSTCFKKTWVKKIAHNFAKFLTIRNSGFCKKNSALKSYPLGIGKLAKISLTWDGIVIVELPAWPLDPIRPVLNICPDVFLQVFAIKGLNVGPTKLIVEHWLLYS